MEKLDKQTYRKVEAILYEYKTYDSAIKNLEAEIEEIQPLASKGNFVPAQQTAVAPGDTSPTEGLAIYRLESKRALKLYSALKKKKARKEAIEEALSYANETERQIFELKYMQEKQHYEIFERLKLTKQGYSNKKDRFISKIAAFLSFR